MTEVERAKSIVKWLISNRVALTQKGIAQKMGYNHSVLSQVLNGRVSMTEKFMQTLCSLDSRLNYEWLLNGSGEMLLSENVVALKSTEGTTVSVILPTPIKGRSRKKSGGRVLPKTQNVIDIPGLMNLTVQMSKTIEKLDTKISLMETTISALKVQIRSKGAKEQEAPIRAAIERVKPGQRQRTLGLGRFQSRVAQNEDARKLIEQVLVDHGLELQKAQEMSPSIFKGLLKMPKNQRIKKI